MTAQMTDAELDQCRRDGALLRSMVSRKVKLEREGRDWKGRCPFHAEKTPSFHVYEDGHYHCFGCNQHGTVFDFIMQTERVDFPAAKKRVAVERGISPSKRHARKANGNGADHDDTWQPIVPPPADAPKPSEQQLQCDVLYEYPGTNDRLLCFVRRLEAKNGKRKQFFPLTYGVLNGKRGWHDKAPATPRPLYGLNRLSHAAPDATVILVEGEKAADAAQRLFPHHVALTWMGGAAADGSADLSPLEGRNVILWPDADQPGRDVMARIAKRLTRIRLLDTADLADGYDAANLEGDGCDDPDAWLAARLREPEPADHELPVIPWLDERLSDWANRSVPLRGWVVPDWIPRGQCTGLYGVGGVNKTDLLIQLLLAKALGLPFIGYMLEPGPAYGLFLEDSREEIVRRAIRIAQTAWGYDSLDAFHNFHFVSLVGFDEPEFVGFDGTKMESKPALFHVDRKIMEIGAHLVTLDTLPHFFGGNEIVRREVSRFIRKLDGISIARGCAFVVSAHPSARGRTSGSMESGSTGWEGGFRARLGLSDPGLEGGDDEPALKIASDRRVLTRIKSNYAKQGETIDLVIRDGTFFVTAVGPEAKRPKSGPERNAACDEMFLQLLAAVAAQGSHVNESVHSGRYAPKEFRARPDGKDFSLAEFTRAMGRLFAAKRIRVIDFGPPSRGWRKIIDVEAEPDPEPDAADEIAPEPLVNLPAAPTKEEITTAIADHIKLDEGERALQRVATADRLGGMKLRVFDGLVAAARKRDAPTEGNANERIALRCLDQAMKADAILAPVLEGGAEGMAVREADWRGWFYQGMPDADQEIRRQAFTRAMAGLLAKGQIGSRDGFVWPLGTSR